MRRAFTLLEVLLAISLTGVVGIAAMSLQTMQARIGEAARTREEALAVLCETVRLLDDDLVLAVADEGRGRVAIEDGSLVLRTSCRLPGDEPGLHEVRWSFDAARGALLRSATPLAGGPPTVRAVGRLWQDCRFGLRDRAVWLDGRLAGLAWRMPLWSEAP